MKFRDFVEHWKEVILLAFATIGLGFGSIEFYKANVYDRADLQAIVTGEVDERLPANKQDRFSMRLSVVNAGTQEAALLQADLVALRKEGDGYAWVRIFPAIGEGFEAKAFKPGEIAIISIITSGYGHQYFTDLEYSRSIDDKHHEFILGLRTASMDSEGRVYRAVYAINQFKIRNDFAGGSGPPSEGYTCEYGPHQLLADIPGRIPAIATDYNCENPWP